MGDPDSKTVGTAVRAFARSGDAESALERCARGWRSWLASGDMDDGMVAAAAALEAPGAQTVEPWYARVLYADGLFAFRAGDVKRSRARNVELLRVARETGDVRGECDGLTGMARIALREGRYEDVVSLAREGLERARAARDAAAEDGPRHLEAVGVRMLGDYRRARELYLESLAAAQSAGNVDRVATEEHNLGWVDLHLGDVESAEARFRRRDGSGVDNAYLEAWRDLSWAAVACLRKDWTEARRRFGVGMKALEALQAAPDPDDALELEWLSTRLGEDPAF